MKKGIKSKIEHLELKHFNKINDCPICFSKKVKIMGKRKTIHPKSNHEFCIKRCLSCNHQFTDPSPKQIYLNQLYSLGSLSVFGERWVDETKREFEENLSFIKSKKENWIIEKEINNTKGNYLEIGPGDGKCLGLFKRLGYNCYAIELGDWANSKLNFFKNISDLPKELYFDVIVVENVLEHVAEPNKTMNSLSLKLKRGGRIYLSFPNSDSLRAILMKTSWRMIRPIGHLHYFSSRSIDTILSKNGLILLNKKNHDFIYSEDVKIRVILKMISDSLLRFKFRQALRYFFDYLVHILCSSTKRGDQWRISCLKR